MNIEKYMHVYSFFRKKDSDIYISKFLVDGRLIIQTEVESYLWVRIVCVLKIVKLVHRILATECVVYTEQYSLATSR